MASSTNSMLSSFFLFTVMLSLQEMYRGKLASSELFTILGGFISSILFLVLLTQLCVSSLGATSLNLKFCLKQKLKACVNVSTTYFQVDYGVTNSTKVITTIYMASLTLFASSMNLFCFFHHVHVFFLRLMEYRHYMHYTKFLGNFQESCGVRTGWGAVILAEFVALVAAGTVHRVCVTTCFLFSMVFLYEINKLSGMIHGRADLKAKRY